MSTYKKKARKYKFVRRGIVLIHFSTDPNAITSELLEQIAATGAETVQVPVLDVSLKTEYVKLARRAAEHGLIASVVTVCPGADENGSISCDPGGEEVQQSNFERYLLSVCEIAKAMQMFEDEPVKVVGPLAEPLGGSASAEEAKVGSPRWNRSVATLARVANKAENLGVELMIEWLNRWEQRLLCNAARGKAFICAVNEHSRVGDAFVTGLYDSHHANIEGSRDPEDDIEQFLPVLGGYHPSENTRGIIGTGRAAIGDELESIFYCIDSQEPHTLGNASLILATEKRPLDLWLEIFSGSDEGLAAATCVWDSTIVGQELKATEHSLQALDGILDDLQFATA